MSLDYANAQRRFSIYTPIGRCNKARRAARAIGATLAILSKSHALSSSEREYPFRRITRGKGCRKNDFPVALIADFVRFYSAALSRIFLIALEAHAVLFRRIIPLKRDGNVFYRRQIEQAFCETTSSLREVFNGVKRNLYISI